MQLVSSPNEKLYGHAYAALFTSSLKPCADDDSTSAGSSERGSSPTESVSSPGRESVRKIRSRQPTPKSSIPAVPPGHFHLPCLPPPPGLAPPPGLLPPPPGLEDIWGALEAVLQAPSSPPIAQQVEYTAKTFRKELTTIFKELASNRNVAAAVRRVRLQNVPLKRQAAEFTDILTRAAEEHRGICRRLFFAFATGLLAGAWDQEQCLAGLKLFFDDVFQDLCEELPRLPTMVRTELVPTLRSILSEDKLRHVVPGHLIEG